MKRFLSLCGVLLLVWALPASAFTPISSPDVSYLASTTYIDPSAISNFAGVTSISDGVMTVSFVDPGSGAPVDMLKVTAPTHWLTWSEDPHS